MKTNLLVLMMILFTVGCSSDKKKSRIKEVDNSEHIKKDYVVRDASQTYRPIWSTDATEWANEKNRDTKQYRYFSFETEPKVSREIACNLARAYTKADVAAEISTMINKTLVETVDGTAGIDQNDPKVASLRDYVETSLVEKVKAKVRGAAIIKTYWEKRQYQKALGAKKDFLGYTCSVLIRIKKERLKDLIDEAGKTVVKQADPSLKERAKEALKKAEANL